MPTVGPIPGGLGNRVIAEANGAGVSLRETIWFGDQVLAVVANANTPSAVMDWGERRRAKPGGTSPWIVPSRRTP